MRSPRRVALTPIAMPSRSLKPAMDLRALVVTGFWPAICCISSKAALTFFESPTASPTPMFSTILSSRGICMSFL